MARMSSPAQSSPVVLEACLDDPPLVDESLDADRPDLWIRVRVDGLEGWVRPEGLERLGVRSRARVVSAAVDHPDVRVEDRLAQCQVAAVG